jgi:chromosome segregation ATPase
MTIPFSRKCVLLLACGTLSATTGCRPKHLEDIKAIKAETEKLVEEQGRVARELSSLSTQLDVLGRDSKRAEDGLDGLTKKKALLEKELARVAKLGDSIVEQREALKKDHGLYAKKYNSK